MPPCPAILIASTTLPDESSAQTLARGAVAAGLAACAQVEGPITSHYVWQGKLECTREWRVVFKLEPSREARLLAWVRPQHPYTTPQWTTFAAGASPDYAAWVAAAGPAQS